MSDHESGAASAARPRRAMLARDPHEPHRVSTPLELLFDLCFVVAVGQAAEHLHHAMLEGHALAELSMYARIFFAIWWAWMNFTWFASAYDTDDVPYRLTILLQIVGVLMLAAGVNTGFAHGNFLFMTFGYAVMRVGLVSLWIRAGRANPAHRKTAYFYAIGVSAVEVGWLAALWLPPFWRSIWWFVAIPLELSVPVLAERYGATPWHAHHISERFGLFTLIVLGEAVLSATNAIETSIEGHFSLGFAGVILGAALIIFSMWWIYFDQPAHDFLRSSRQAFLWGYGHYLVFASTAAVGAGLATVTEFMAGRAEITREEAGRALAVPVILFLLSVWALQVRPARRGLLVDAAFGVGAVLIYLLCGSVAGVLLMGLVLSGVVAVMVLGARRAA